MMLPFIIVVQAFHHGLDAVPLWKGGAQVPFHDASCIDRMLL
jgi:hypothetical protein